MLERREQAEWPARRERAVPPELPKWEVSLPKRRVSQEHELLSPEGTRVSPEHQRVGRGGSSPTFWEEYYAFSEISVWRILDIDGQSLGIGIGEDGMQRR